jgi:hypothetical protein
MMKARGLKDKDFDRDEARQSALCHRKYLVCRMIPSGVESDDEMSDE